MKKSILTAAVALAGVGAFGQSILVSNNNPIFDSNGTTLLGPASGTTFVEEVVLVSGGTVGPVASTISPINQGYFYGPGSSGIVNLPGVAAGAGVTLQVEVWDSTKFTSYAAAAATPGADVGITPVFSYSPGNNSSSPPGAAPALSFGTAANGLTTSIVPNVPEPTTLALGAMGLGALLIRRRK